MLDVGSNSKTYKSTKQLEILRTLGFVLGTVSLILLIVATIVVVYNKKMTSMKKFFCILEILIFPTLGPIMVLIEVVDQKEKEDKLKIKRKKY
jgi:uncharacterized membrane protein required for colicin V production